MPRTRSLAWSELKIGALAVIAIGITISLVFALGGDGGFPWQRYRLTTRVPNAAGVNAGSLVRVAGVNAGSVTSVRFAGAEVEVEFEIRESMRERVRTTSVASIGSVSLLGENAIDITASVEGTPIPDGGSVRYGTSTGSLTEVTSRVSDGLDQISQLVDDLRSGRGTAGQFLTDDRLYRDLQEMANAASSVMRKIEEGDGSIGRLVNDSTMVRELETSLTNLSAVTEQLSEGDGSLGKLLHDDEFIEVLTETTRNFERLGERLNDGDGTIGKLLTDDALYAGLTDLTERFGSVAGQLSEGEGTAASLLNDRELYDNLNATVTELRSLIADIREDPRKYLNVKVSIF